MVVSERLCQSIRNLRGDLLAATLLDEPLLGDRAHLNFAAAAARRNCDRHQRWIQSPIPASDHSADTVRAAERLRLDLPPLT